MTLAPFHLAIPVYDLAAARNFYGDVFGLEEGRSSDHWVDFNFFGHQLVIHEHPKTASQESAHTNAVDGHNVPVPHDDDAVQRVDLIVGSFDERSDCSRRNSLRLRSTARQWIGMNG